MCCHVKSILSALLGFTLIASCTTPATRHRMAELLERAESMNQNDVPMDTVGFMGDVLDFYMSHGSRDERIRANYMMGCFYRDKGDSPMALQYYQDAVGMADTTAVDCDFHKLSRIYGQMALVFHLQRYPQKEIEMWTKAMAMSKKAGDSFMYVVCMDRIGGAYDLLGDWQKSVSITRKAYKLLKDMGHRDYASSLLTVTIDAYLRTDSLEQAKRDIDEYVAYSGLVGPDGEMCRGKEGFYYFLGQYYEKLGRNDSALYYYRKLGKFPQKIMNQECCFKGLMSVYGKLNMTDSVIKFAQLYADANDTANIRHSASEISRAQMLYDYSFHQRVAAQKSEETKVLWIILLGSIIIVSAIGIVCLRYFRGLKEKDRMARRAYALIENRCNVLVKELSQLKSNKEKFIEDKEKEIDHLKAALCSLQQSQKSDKCKHEHETVNQPVVHRFKEYARKGGLVKPMSSEWRDMEAAVQHLMPVFHVRLKEYDLSDIESKICILTRLDFSPKEMSVLLGISSQSVTNSRSAANQKMFNDSSAKSLKRNLLMLHLP